MVFLVSYGTGIFSYKVAAGFGRLLLIEAHASALCLKFPRVTYRWLICNFCTY